MLENGLGVEIDQTLSNYRIAIYSISTLSGLAGIVYKYLPENFHFLLLSSVILYFASQSVAFVLENIVYSKSAFVVAYKRHKFNVYTYVDVISGEFIYSIYPYNGTFDPNRVERVPLGALFYEDGWVASYLVMLPRAGIRLPTIS